MNPTNVSSQSATTIGVNSKQFKGRMKGRVYKVASPYNNSNDPNKKKKCWG